jgi:hypothetical protein
MALGTRNLLDLRVFSMARPPRSGFYICRYAADAKATMAYSSRRTRDERV